MSNLDKVSVIGTLKCTGRFLSHPEISTPLYSEKAGRSVQEQKSVDKQATITIADRMFFIKDFMILILFRFSRTSIPISSVVVIPIWLFAVKTR